ncbi:DMT family transporter [Limnoraphis robusta Tam1]|uniref:DMT family transporter n=1 Tax=Limnoraphis robusta CCNP1315 TaxID=3110306 RepID=A0ABU5U4I6_9CYAN|nr:DMT family transporter [Limnoraphis robusta]MEA5498921.1 DMT family transporter [Limnoraphis robusta BA-68 BA1]MEA5521826.1 DMT family transporter [Limnoraphis robusta CCNP1315]MEA5540475.1 DMT family transporter [Limnoraphis robusta Tam1]MEA5543978.1 DMT family transporter [Limnoraphis robusta CCNP1324]
MENQLKNLNQLSDKRTVFLPFAFLLTALFAIGLAPIFMKFSISEISPNTTIFNRFWMASLVFAVGNGIRAIRQHLSDNSPKEQQKLYTPKNIGLLLLVGSLYAAIQLLWAWSLSRTTVASSVTILHGLRPLLTALGGWILYKNRYDSKFLMGMAIAIIGAILIGFNDFSDSINKLQGDLLSVFSAISSALELLIMEHLITQFSAQTLMFWCCTIGSFVTTITLIITGDQFFPVSWLGWGAVISLALVCQVIGQGLITYSLNYLSSGVVAVTMLLDPVISALFAWTILSEQLNVLNGVFCCIVLLGIYLSLSSKYAVKSETLS